MLLILGALLILCISLPSLWVKRVMRRHSTDLDSIPGSGAELARHLIKRLDLDGIVVEETAAWGDHFHPDDKAVRLSPANYHGRSLTAVAVAAHEVGHAIQFARGEQIFELRRKYIPVAAKLDRAGVAILWLLPLVGLLIRAPAAIMAVVGISLLLQLLGALAYFIVLPEEWDASFNKALPILLAGNYVDKSQLAKVRQLLRAAALTYAAGALAKLLNIGRWLIFLRR